MSEETKDIKTFTQEELNEQIKERLAREKAKYQKEIESMKAEFEEFKQKQAEENELQKLSEKDQLEKKLEKMQKENEALKQEKAYQTALNETKAELNKRSINASDDLIKALTTNNTENTLNNINAFETFLTDQRSSWEKERATGTTPSSYSTNDSTKQVTRKEFDKMTFAERAKFANENPEAFDHITKGKEE